MHQSGSVFGVAMVVAALFAAGCQNSDGERFSASPAAMGATSANPAPGPNSGDFDDGKGDALSRRPSLAFEVEGSYFAAIPGQTVVRREVLKLKPITPKDGTERDYTVLLAVPQKVGELNWVTSPVKRLFESKDVRVDLPAEPGIEVQDSGTVVVTGTGPIVSVKKATVASDGTTFVVEATKDGGWVLAVFKATKPVLVYLEDSAQAVEVDQDELLVVSEQANAIPAPIPKEARFKSLLSYTTNLLEATGTEMK